MARYNSVNSTGSVAGGNTISTPASGLLTTLTGTGTVTLPNPVLYTGSTQTFYNSTGAAITLSTPSGNFTGPGTGGTSTLSLPAGSILTVVSDGTNYIAQDWLGGAITTSGTVTFNGTIAANPTNLSVSIQPTGSGVLTLSSGTTGSLDNVNVGATTQGTGKFSSLIATGTLSTTATTVATLGTTGTGALQVAGGASVAGILNVGGATYHAGNVSVGTSSTSYKLTVQGDTNAVAAQVIPQGALPDNNDNAGLYVLHQGTAGTGLRVRTDNALTGTIFAHVLVNNASAGINGFQVSQYGTGFIADFNKGGVAANSVRINNSGNVGIGTTSPGATLDLGSRTDAIILPAGTTAQRPGTAVAGMQRWNSSLSAMEYYNGSSWSQKFVLSYSIDFVVLGAGGGGGGYDGGGTGGSGGSGAIVYGTVTVFVGDALVITIGGGGGSGGGNSTGGGSGSAGSNGGARGGNAGGSGSSGGGGGGGGYSAIVYNASDWAYAGGGAGGGGSNEGDQNEQAAGGGGSQPRGSQGAGTYAGGAGFDYSGDGGGGGGGGGGRWGGNGQSQGAGLGASGGGNLATVGTAVNGNNGSSNSNSNTAVPTVGGSWWTFGGGYGQGGAGANTPSNSVGGNQGQVIIRYLSASQKGSGGTVSPSGGYYYHTFTGAGTFTA